MDYAICYLAIGDKSLELLRISYQTLRRSGFNGDVHILTTVKTFPFGTDERTHVHIISSKHLNLDLQSAKPLATCDARHLNLKKRRNARLTEKFAICHAKTLIHEYVPFDKYDYVVYLDVDILVAGPINTFESYLSNHKGSIVTARSKVKTLGGNRFYMTRRWLVNTSVTANLTVWELFKYWHQQPICADIICIPATDVGKRLLLTWRRECQKGIDSDQAALQAVLLRHFPEKHILAPYEIFGYGPPATQSDRTHSPKDIEKVESVFVHFNGALRNDKIFNMYYEKYFK